MDARDTGDLTRGLRDTIELIDASTEVDDAEQHRGEHHGRQAELNERLSPFAAVGRQSSFRRHQSDLENHQTQS